MVPAIIQLRHAAASTSAYISQLVDNQGIADNMSGLVETFLHDIKAPASSAARSSILNPLKKMFEMRAMSAAETGKAASGLAFLSTILKDPRTGQSSRIVFAVEITKGLAFIPPVRRISEKMTRVVKGKMGPVDSTPKRLLAAAATGLSAGASFAAFETAATPISSTVSIMNGQNLSLKEALARVKAAPFRGAVANFTGSLLFIGPLYVGIAAFYDPEASLAERFVTGSTVTAACTLVNQPMSVIRLEQLRMNTKEGVVATAKKIIGEKGFLTLFKTGLNPNLVRGTITSLFMIPFYDMVANAAKASQ